MIQTQVIARNAAKFVRQLDQNQPIPSFAQVANGLIAAFLSKHPKANRALVTTDAYKHINIVMQKTGICLQKSSRGRKPTSRFVTDEFRAEIKKQMH